MDHRILEIVFYLMDSLRDDKLSLDSLTEVMPDLEEFGFSPDDIAIAHHWLADRLRHHRGTLYTQAPRMQVVQRVFTEEERALLDVDARSFLLKLANLGIIDIQQLEAIVDQAFVYGQQPVTVDQVKWLVTGIMSGELVPEPSENDIPLRLDPPSRIN